MPEIIEIDLNPEIKTYKKTEGFLVIERTHDKPVVHSDSYNIEQAQAKLDKIDGVIALWEAKKVPLQEVIDKYNEIA